MPSGAFRHVFLVGPFAVKVPRLRYLRLAMRCNRWELEMWRKWRRKFGWRHLCPIRFADPLGLLVVMPRAQQPVSAAEVREALGDYYPDATTETKPEDWGRIGDHVVALDYGWAWETNAEMDEQRRYYDTRQGPH
jgi:hypothetical protein